MGPRALPEVPAMAPARTSRRIPRCGRYPPADGLLDDFVHYSRSFLRRQDCPADFDLADAVAVGQCERRPDLRVGRDGAIFRRHAGALADHPDDRGATRLEVAKVDPRGAARAAVDEHARALAGILGDVAADPHA